VSPFEVVHCYKPRRPLDIFLMSPHARASESANAVAQHVHDLQNEINKQTQATNAQYKIEVDLCRCLTEFNIRIMSWSRLDSKGFHQDSSKNCKLIVSGHSTYCSGLDQMCMSLMFHPTTALAPHLI
jgi:hypothetical protein